MEDSRPQTPDALAILVENHRRFLSFLKHRVANPSDAEEILQAAFVKSVEKSNAIRDSETVVAWFYRLLRNAVIDYYRHANAGRQAIERLALMETETGDTQPDVEKNVCRCVTDLLPTLKDDYSALLRRVDLEETSIGDVAAQTGQTTNNVRVKLHRARAAMRKQLLLSCGICARHGCLDCDCKG